MMMNAMTVTWMPRPTDEQFDRAAALLERSIGRAKGEFTIEDLRARARDGRALIGLAERDGAPVMAAAIEIGRYPRFTVLNVIALAGEDLAAVAAQFYDELKAFARSCGAAYIEADCSPGMARLLKLEFGFEHAYEKVRCSLTKPKAKEQDHG